MDADIHEAAALGISPDSPRWGQLSYASFDAGNGTRGGWQVKERSAGLLDTEVALLQARIVTQFDPDVEPSDFPGAAEVAAMPRRFTHVCGPSGQSRYWHSVMAGRDSTGRPGNVFSHVLVDRRPDSFVPGLRPVQWWDSPDVLRPFGVDQVTAAHLPTVGDGGFAPGLSARDVQDFLFAPNEWRAGLLAVLLDAVAAAMGGGPGVVLVTGSARNAALWTAAVSFLCSPHFARRLNFSLYERAGALGTVFARGVHLACVPRVDASLLGSDGTHVILDEFETPNMGDTEGNPHTTAAGSRIAATYWGTLAQDAVASRKTAEEAMAELDRISLCVGDTGTDPSWPLAMTAVRKPHIFADAAAEAIEVLKLSSPLALSRDTALQAEAVQAIRSAGSIHAGDAWVELSNGPAAGLVREILIQTYVERALGDVEWLERPGSVPLPEDHDPAANTLPMKAAAESAVLQLRTRLAEHSSREAVLAGLKVLDFIAATSLVDLEAGSDAELADARDEILERVVSAVIDFDDEGKALVDHTGALKSGVLHAKVMDVVARSNRFEESAPGHRMPPAFRDWLFPAAAPRTIANELDAGAVKLDPMVVELALWQCKNGQGTADRARVAAAIGVLEFHKGTGFPAELVTAVLHAGPAWSGAELCAVESRHPGALGGNLFYHALLEEHWSRRLESLCRMAVKRGLQDETPLEAKIAELRLAAERTSSDGVTLAHAWTQGDATTVVEISKMFLGTLEETLEALERPHQSPAVTALMVVAAVIVLGTGPAPMQPWPAALKKQLRGLGDVPEPGIAVALAGCVRSQVLSIADAEHLGRMSLYLKPRFPESALMPERFMAGMRVELDQEWVPALEVPLRIVLSTMPLYDMDGAAAATMDVMRKVATTGESERQREKALQEREKVFRDWWQQLCSATGRLDPEPGKPAFLDSLKSFKSSVLRKDR
ncbi:hypothetical protein [Arthrobacter sp.]|uniref:GAP1-N2 domain-containing protein n=1 Tax=Arthrobacter sp. TaxID=1667 RepID=UPI0026DF15A7|nr:hypothetical protein [Arthrobacter sp.]MDO5752292.1 hypothetical protein [Arthrobacter sp.]